MLISEIFFQKEVSPLSHTVSPETSKVTQSELLKDADGDADGDAEESDVPTETPTDCLYKSVNEPSLGQAEKVEGASDEPPLPPSTVSTVPTSWADLLKQKG